MMIDLSESSKKNNSPLLKLMANFWKRGCYPLRACLLGTVLSAYSQHHSEARSTRLPYNLNHFTRNSFAKQMMLIFIKMNSIYLAR